MSSMSRSTLRSQIGGIYESETSRLQREVDNFTSKFEQEKRRLLIIEEQIKQINEELEAKDKNVKSLMPSFIVEKKTNINMKSNSKNVNNEKLKLN